MTVAAEHQAERASPRPARKNGRTRNLLLVDAGLFALFAVVINVPMTGIAIHEWLGIAIAAASIVHLVQHADWVLTMGHRLFARTSFQNRVNYLLMIALFVGFASISVSGLLISESALPYIGVHPEASSYWYWIHVSSVGWVIALSAIHIAVNWRWVDRVTERLVFAPLREIGRRG